MVNYVLWLPYLVTRTAETMVKESKVKERSNFSKYRRNVRLCSDLFTDLVSSSSSSSSSSSFFCQHFIDLYLQHDLTDFDQTWSQVPVDHPIYVI